MGAEGFGLARLSGSLLQARFRGSDEFDGVGDGAGGWEAKAECMKSAALGSAALGKSRHSSLPHVNRFPPFLVSLRGCEEPPAPHNYGRWPQPFDPFQPASIAPRRSKRRFASAKRCAAVAVDTVIQAEQNVDSKRLWGRTLHATVALPVQHRPEQAWCFPGHQC